MYLSSKIKQRFFFYFEKKLYVLNTDYSFF